MVKHGESTDLAHRASGLLAYDADGQQVVEIFENQRRMLFWDSARPENMLPNERKKWSDRHGKLSTDEDFDLSGIVTYKKRTRFHHNSECWRVDKEYTLTDDNGWTYGATFGRIEFRLAKNRSRGKPGLYSHCRRRRWIRPLVPGDEEKDFLAVLGIVQTKPPLLAASPPIDDDSTDESLQAQSEAQAHEEEEELMRRDFGDLGDEPYLRSHHSENADQKAQPAQRKSLFIFRSFYQTMIESSKLEHNLDDRLSEVPHPEHPDNVESLQRMDSKRAPTHEESEDLTTQLPRTLSQVQFEVGLSIEEIVDQCSSVAPHGNSMRHALTSGAWQLKEVIRNGLEGLFMKYLPDSLSPYASPASKTHSSHDGEGEIEDYSTPDVGLLVDHLSREMLEIRGPRYKEKLRTLLRKRLMVGPRGDELHGIADEHSVAATRPSLSGAEMEDDNSLTPQQLSPGEEVQASEGETIVSPEAKGGNVVEAKVPKEGQRGIEISSQIPRAVTSSNAVPDVSTGPPTATIPLSSRALRASAGLLSASAIQAPAIPIKSSKPITGAEGSATSGGGAIRSTPAKGEQQQSIAGNNSHPSRGSLHSLTNFLLKGTSASAAHGASGANPNASSTDGNTEGEASAAPRFPFSLSRQSALFGGSGSATTISTPQNTAPSELTTESSTESDETGKRRSRSRSVPGFLGGALTGGLLKTGSDKNAAEAPSGPEEDSKHFKTELKRAKQKIFNDIVETPSTWDPAICPKLRIVIMLVGSRGDVQPFIAFAKVLRDGCGHHVRIATHETFRQWIEGHGFDFFPLAGDPKLLMDTMTNTTWGSPAFWKDVLSTKRIFIRDLLRSGKEACFASTQHSLEATGLAEYRAEAIIANPPAYPAMHMAEYLGIPIHMSFTMPWSRTVEFHSPFMTSVLNPDRHLTNYQSFIKVDMLMWYGPLDLINEFRKKELGLPPWRLRHHAHSCFHHKKVPHFYSYSTALLPRPSDWGPHIDVVGYFFLDNSDLDFTPSQELMAFLQDQPPPVFVGFGSIVIADPKKFLHTIMSAIQKAGVRAIIQSGWAGFEVPEDCPDSILFVGAIPHDWLFPRVSAVVHHGGAGTTAAGLRCGRPTIVVPFFGDQIASKAAERIISEDSLWKAVRAFHRNLPLSHMRCNIFPDKVAHYFDEARNLRLSREAASIMLQQGKASHLCRYHPVDWSDSAMGYKHGLRNCQSWLSPLSEEDKMILLQCPAHKTIENIKSRMESNSAEITRLQVEQEQLGSDLAEAEAALARDPMNRAELRSAVEEALERRKKV